jgi:sulfide:quinone oxidoreductase
MKRLLVLGAGTAGTMVANKLRRRLDRHEWTVTVVDQDDEHHYQPGYLFIPFGGYDRADVVRSRHHFLGDGIELVLGEIDRVEPEEHRGLHVGGRELGYD